MFPYTLRRSLLSAVILDQRQDTILVARLRKISLCADVLDNHPSFQSRKMPHPRPLPSGNISHHRAERRAGRDEATMRLDSNAAAK
jgi:hypothetical protein